MSGAYMALNSLLGAGTYVDSSGWAAGLMAPYGIAYPQALAVAATDMEHHQYLGPPQQQQQTCWKTPATDDCSTRAASDTLTWSVQQHAQPAGITTASDARWMIAGHNSQQRKDDDDEADVRKDEQQVAPFPSVQDNQQRITKQHRQVHRDTSFTSGQVSSAAAATAHSAGSPGTCVATAAVTAFTAAAREAQLQSSTSNHSGSFVSPAAMMSPAAFVHNAQQMLLQQQQQFHQLQQQQVLLGLQQQQAEHVQHQQCNQQLSGGMATATAAAGPLAAGWFPEAAEDACSPSSMRAALGDRTFFSIRSLLMKQQEAFVQQLYELHRLVRVQHMACSEVQGKYHALTEQYGRAAALQVQCSQSIGVCLVSKPTFSALTTAAAAPPAKEANQSAAGQWQCTLAGERPSSSDDLGAAAVSALPVHAVLLNNLPSTMRAAVSTPAAGDCAALTPARFYVGQSSGVPRPTAAKAVTRGGSKVTPQSAAAAVATAAPTVSDNNTVQMDNKAAVGARSTPQACKQQQQQYDERLVEFYKQQQQAWSGPQRRSQPSSSSAPTTGLDRPLSAVPAAAAAVTCRPIPRRPPLSPVPGGLPVQQQQQMPPPPPMLPQLAAQHVAAAAAQHQQLLLQQQRSGQQEDAPGNGRANAGLPAASGLNVFRPMPQINPTYAPKFLAGGHQRALSTAMPVPRFDPHSYWMKRHYGAEAEAPAASTSIQAQSAGGASPAAALDASTGAAVESSFIGHRAQPTAASLRALGSAAKQQLQRSKCAAGPADSSQLERDAVAAASAPRPVVQWWQDAAATFGEVGLLDPNTQGLATNSQMQRGLFSGDRAGSSAKRTLPNYNLQQLPLKKRGKLAAAACPQSYTSGGYAAPGHYQGHRGAGHPAGVAQYGYFDDAAASIGAQNSQDEEALRPVVRQSASKERSRVRSNHVGSSRQGESVCSDNSASSIDNPSASVAAGAVHAPELGPDADGVSLLLHMGQHAGTSGAAQAKVAKHPVGAHESAAAPVFGGQATARSAAALLLSLSGSFG